MPLSFDLQRQVSRFRRLPQSGDVWEGAIVDMPFWVDGGPGAAPYRPSAAVWVSTTRHLAHVKNPDDEHGQPGIDDAVVAVCQMGTSPKLAGERPRALRVRDANLAAALRDALPDTGVAVELAHELPALDAFLSETAAAMSEDRVPGALTAPGVTPDRLRAFADAAKLFFEAAPWHHLNDEGVLRALAATTEAEMDSGRWSHTVTTAEGTQRYTLALPDLLAPPATPPAFDPRANERLTAEIARTLRSRDFATIDDANAALEAQFTGRTLDDIPSTAASPLGRAQDLMYQAFETRGRRQLHLIRQALALSPDCADAYLLLSERSSSADDVRSLLEQAVAAAERGLGPAAFSDPDRSFWADVATRPYMRARTSLAEFLAASREFDPAITHYRALLDLNPDDNQGLRFRLMTTLLEAERNAEGEALLSRYDEDAAEWRYAGVLLALRAGDRKEARKRLRAATLLI